MMQAYSHNYNGKNSTIDPKMDEILLKNHLSLLFTNSSPGTLLLAYVCALFFTGYSKEYTICCHLTC